MSDKRDQSNIWSGHTNFDLYHNMQFVNDRSKWFVEQIKEYEFSSVLEIGTMTGRNLDHILKNFQNIEATGIDVNKNAIKYASSKVPDADFRAIDVYDLKEDKKWDLVFTMGVLIHIHPDGIEQVIKKCTNIANKYIIHMERNGNREVITGPADLNPARSEKKLHWKPNIDKIYKNLGFSPVVIDVPDGINRSGASHFVVVDLSNK